MRISTIDRHFAVDAAPLDRIVKLDPTARRLTLDVIEISGSGTIAATLTEQIPSFREVEIISTDTSAVDTFQAGRQIRGSQSGQHATAISQRTSGGKTFLQYDSGSLAKFFDGELIEERSLTGTATAARAVVSSQPTQAYIDGEQIATSGAASGDVVADIAAATQTDPRPNTPRLVKLAYVFGGNPSNVSWVLRVS